MGKFINLEGERFGEWSVIERAENANCKQTSWVCECSCGNIRNVRSQSLRSGGSSRCSSCSVKLTSTTHGMTHSVFYSVWDGMKQRCFNENNDRYSRYGGRGITVCKKWKDSFEEFYNDMQQSYKKGLQLDRRENDGDYDPGNCRWVTPVKNIRNSSVVKINEEVAKVIKFFLKKGMSSKKLADVHKISPHIIADIKRGKSWKDIKI